jgi:hypothetical protein
MWYLGAGAGRILGAKTLRDDRLHFLRTIEESTSISAVLARGASLLVLVGSVSREPAGPWHS